MRVQNKILTSGFSFLLFVVQTAFPAEWVNVGEKSVRLIGCRTKVG